MQKLVKRRFKHQSRQQHRIMLWVTLIPSEREKLLMLCRRHQVIHQVMCPHTLGSLLT
eukprot:XP_001709942.1 Hypothetical protein GL50803_37862 [Giardia lamblia ATCC 50803]